jgi:hypothetical protein
MNDTQEVPASIRLNNRISCLIVTACIDNDKKRIEECLSRLLKGNAVMFARVALRFILVLHKGDAIEYEIYVHDSYFK